MEFKVSQWLSGIFSRQAELPSTTVSEEQKQEWLNHIRLVGKHKLIGELPIKTIIIICQEDPATLKRAAEERGLKAFIMSDKPEKHSASLYVYDLTNLQKFINLLTNKKIIEDHNWPVEASRFAEQVVGEDAPQGPLYDLVALAFNDPRYKTYVGYDGGPERLPEEPNKKAAPITSFPGTS